MLRQAEAQPGSLCPAGSPPTRLPSSLSVTLKARCLPQPHSASQEPGALGVRRVLTGGQVSRGRVSVGDFGEQVRRADVMECP